MKNYWNKQTKKGKMCFLAPMDGYGDSAYRQTIKKVAPHIYAISEFYSADGLVHSKFLAGEVLVHKKIENPLVIQIFGKDPEMFAKAAKIIERYDVVGIDVNMGCPAKKVVRSGHGSSLMIDTNTAFKIVNTLNKSTKLPISVKTRIGYKDSKDLITFAKGLENAGCSLLTVHGRTTQQAYTGISNWDPIYELKKHLNIPIIGNGDVKNYTEGIKKSKNLDGFMIGRASFGNPWCFVKEENLNICHSEFVSESLKNINNLKDPETSSRGYSITSKGCLNNLNKNNFINGVYYPSLLEILEMMDFHAKVLVETKGERRGSLEIRKHLVQYLKNFPGVKAYRKRLVTTESLKNSIEVIGEIKKEFKDFLDKKPGLGEIG